MTELKGTILTEVSVECSPGCRPTLAVEVLLTNLQRSKDGTATVELKPAPGAIEKAVTDHLTTHICNAPRIELAPGMSPN